MKKYEIFVATDGCDTNEGTIESPLATINGALRRARPYRYDRQIVINVRGGDYYPDRTTVFGADDGGIDERYPTICQAYRNERVTFHGGRAIPKEKFSRVTDESVLSRIIDKKAKGKLWQVDLSHYADCLLRGCSRHAYHRRNFPVELYMDGAPMVLSRWPKKVDDSTRFGSYAYTTEYKTAKNGDRIIYMEDEARERMKLWNPKSCNELFLSGYIGVEYTASTERIRKMNADKGFFQTVGKFNSYNAPDGKKRRRLFVSNILDEISKPGEYYIDYDKQVMYFIPKKSIDKTEIILPAFDETMFYIGMSTMNLVFRKINTAYTRGRVMDIVELNGPSWGPILIEGCTFAHGTQRAITLRRAFKVTIRGCKIYDFGYGAINAECCGQRGDLRSSEIVIEECDIHDVSRINWCYTGINLGYETSGFIIRKNRIYNSPHYVLGLSCVDSIVEDNEFFNAVRDTDDSSIIYWGRDAAAVGLIIRGNYFHDWGNNEATWGIAGVYTDDGALGAEIYNNIFENSPQPEKTDFPCVKAAAESFSHIHNNIFINCGAYHRIGSWDNVYNMGISDWLPPVLGIYTAKQSVKRFDQLAYDGYFTHIWREKYKGTNWERMRKYVNMAACAKYQGILESLVADGEDREIAVNRVIIQMQNDYWNHKLGDGSTYGGELSECLRTVLKENFDAAMAPIDKSNTLALLEREVLLIREMYYFGKLVPEHTVETHDNICINAPASLIAENGKMKLGAYQAETELQLPCESVDGEPVFADRASFTLSASAVEYIKEKLPAFVPFSLKLLKK